jgi:hypothetical protein
MQVNVGKRADDPLSDLSGYPYRVGGSKILSNGNSEIELFAGGRPGCSVFFEIDKDTNIIIGWRYVGGERHCVIQP